MRSARGAGSRTDCARILSVVVWAAGGVCGGCSDVQLAAINEAIRDELVRVEVANSCGPGQVESLIPDCPVPGVCFTSACAAHDQCYTTCGSNRRACDDEFWKGLQGACDAAFRLGHPRFDDCRYAALTYWLSVSVLGQSAWVTAQDRACGGLPPPSEPEGVCCLYGESVACMDGVTGSTCGAGGVFVGGLTCIEVVDLFGGCPLPENDLCEGRTRICEGVPAGIGLGRCKGETGAERGGGVCDVASQDCPNDLACLPVERVAFRCTVATDNRLADTDGPPVPGGCSGSDAESFQADVWYEWTAPCDGTLSLRMCGADTYDAMLAVYGGESETCACPAEDVAPLSCNDDFCRAFGSVSGLDVSVSTGKCYVFRVGGWALENSAASAARGLSELDIGVFCGTPMEIIGPE